MSIFTLFLKGFQDVDGHICSVFYLTLIYICLLSWFNSYFKIIDFECVTKENFFTSYSLLTQSNNKVQSTCNYNYKIDYTKDTVKVQNTYTGSQKKVNFICSTCCSTKNCLY